MRIIDATGPIDDLWPRIGAGEPLPEAGRALVERDRLGEALASGLELGLHLPPDTEPADIEPHFGRLAMISVGFPSFADGRGFSIGRSLRQRGFLGRLRASGPVIADQFAYLLECGFDEVAIPEEVARRQPPESWLSQSAAITFGYQRGIAGRGSILDQRRARHD
ncbi:hypothetical protein LNKW23_20370 [Paralimibaculum aggregatum]|uniref:DUF934 domain-containing protein n=1 Tax=Paralimibaculum aggregatum TaxID=3036245 RepID=A0ABQ6LKQ3_9RHOB|nr:DUF934 domain-containing protein [Limibaculum sp. NKW23]GMG82824.1 hypothetical protein LNKW23_20370 [Limibaculum sp. NKW23]